MLNNQDFAQSQAKSLGELPSAQVLAFRGRTKPAEISLDLSSHAKECLQETITKIEGAYAPSTIRAYRVDFQDLIKFCTERNANSLPAEPNLIVQYICKLTGSGRSSASIRRAIAGIATIHKPHLSLWLDGKRN